jgi:hypothetical protein
MVTELKVSGNLMTLDAGLFCIFNAPGSALPDPGTGLPGVRVSLPPGPVFRPEAVTITSFRDDGWLGGWNGAALVRVTRGPAHVLVTIYQAPNSNADAPRLQIMRLAESGALPPLGQPQAVPAGAVAPGMAARPPALQAANAPAAPAGPGPRAVPAPAPAANPQNTPAGAGASDGEAAKRAEIVAHIQGRGDVMARLDEWTGEPDSKRWIEGFAVSPKASFPGTTIGPADVEYQAVLGRGWLSPWAEGGQYCGSRGMSLPILGLRMRLRGEAAERFDCVVTASFVDGTKVGPLDNGEPCQAESMSPLEAFKITLIDRNAADLPAAAAPAAEPDLVVIDTPARRAAGRPPRAAPAVAEVAAPKPAAPKSAAPPAPPPVVARPSGRAAPPPKPSLPGKPAVAPKSSLPPQKDKAQPRGKR